MQSYIRPSGADRITSLRALMAIHPPAPHNPRGLFDLVSDQVLPASVLPVFHSVDTLRNRRWDTSLISCNSTCYLSALFSIARQRWFDTDFAKRTKFTTSVTGHRRLVTDRRHMAEPGVGMAVSSRSQALRGTFSALTSAAPRPRMSAKIKDVPPANPSYPKAYEAPQRTCRLKGGSSAPLIRALQI